MTLFPLATQLSSVGVKIDSMEQPRLVRSNVASSVCVKAAFAAAEGGSAMENAGFHPGTARLSAAVLSSVTPSTRIKSCVGSDVRSPSSGCGDFPNSFR
jgi:hypothetical protein